MDIVCILSGSAVRERSSEDVTVLPCGCAYTPTHWLQGCKPDFAPFEAAHREARRRHVAQRIIREVVHGQ